MEIVLKTREEQGLAPATTSTTESGIAKDLFKGLDAVLNVRTGVRPSVTFIDSKTNKSITVCVEKDLETPVRTGKITKEHLMGFTVLRANNDGLYFVAPKARATFKVDDVVVDKLDAVSYNDLAGY